MADAYLDWNGDFMISASGGLLLADGETLSNQRIIRRICTQVGAYVWHPEYGAGLPQRIGQSGIPKQIEAIVRAQISLEETVAVSPSPTVTVEEDANNLGAFIISISYTFAATGEAVSLSFSSSTGS